MQQEEDSSPKLSQILTKEKIAQIAEAKTAPSKSSSKRSQIEIKSQLLK
jgi:hypothetical protein